MRYLGKKNTCDFKKTSLSLNTFEGGGRFIIYWVGPKLQSFHGRK
jgi:hypothetical protein